MKVSELIEALKKAPQDAEVTTEGCDCFGDVGKAVIWDEPGAKGSVGVMLCRSNSADFKDSQAL